MTKQGLLLALLFVICVSGTSANQPPIGEFEQITSQGEVQGWTYDPDNASQPIDVKFLIDDLHSIIIKAYTPRSEGGFSFSWNIPNSYRDGVEHSLNIYALDLAGETYPKINPSTLHFAIMPPQYDSCSVGDIVIIHAASRRFFSKKYVGQGDCFAQSELRECNDGILSGSYTNADCYSGYAPCSFNGDTIEHGYSVVAYKTASVSHGSSCQSESRICNSGSLSGSFGYSSCSVEPTQPLPIQNNPSPDEEINCLELYIDERMNYPQCQSYLPQEQQQTQEQQKEVYCSLLSEQERQKYPDCNVVVKNSEVVVVMPDTGEEIYTEDPEPTLIANTKPKTAAQQKEPEKEELNKVPTQQVELIKLSEPLTKKEPLPKKAAKHPKKHKECTAYCSFMVFFSWLFG